MAQQTTIQEIANQVGFKGTPRHRLAEPSSIRTLSPIDNVLPNQPTIRTSIDCYVSGQYVQQNGQIMEVTQRYTLFIGYSQQTQFQTMQAVRGQIADDFQSRYGGSFNITTIHIPSLLSPEDNQVKKTAPEPEQMYGGSRMFRDMTRYERARYEMDTERTKARLNIESIKDRYKMRR